MISRRSVSLALAGALVLSVGARPTFAQSAAEQLRGRIRPRTESAFLFLSKNNEARDDKLRSDLARLVSDAKAGKIVPRSESQLPSGKSRNLSKTAKIAIIAGVAVVVVGLIGWYAFTHGECKSRCVL